MLISKKKKKKKSVRRAASQITYQGKHCTMRLYWRVFDGKTDKIGEYLNASSLLRIF